MCVCVCRTEIKEDSFLHKLNVQSQSYKNVRIETQIPLKGIFTFDYSKSKTFLAAFEI